MPYVRFADTTVFQVVPLLSGLVFTLIILLPKAPIFATIFILVSIAFVVVSFTVTRKVRYFAEIQATAKTAQTGYLADAVTNVMAIKSFAV
ncbi:MAG: hypothetical protein WDN66_00130 [Candidatus Saccharibacteria bacterium]